MHQQINAFSASVLETPKKATRVGAPPFFAPLGRFGLPFWRPLDFKWGPKIDHSLTKHWITKKSNQEVAVKKHEFGMNFSCQKTRPWEAKTSISHYTCSNLRSFCGTRNLMENRSQKVIRNHPKSVPREQWAGSLWFSRVFGGARFLVFLGAAKRVSNIEKYLKFGCTNAKTRHGGPSIRSPGCHLAGGPRETLVKYINISWNPQKYPARGENK